MMLLCRYLELSSNSTRLSTEVEFSCSNGNNLIGPEKVVCLTTGTFQCFHNAIR